MRLQKFGAVGAALALLLTVVTLGGSASSGAATTPPWEPDPQTATTGNIVFYDATGNVVTSGSDLTNLFAYAAATSATPRAGTTKAFISYAFPKSGAPTGSWFNTADSVAKLYPNASAPAPVNAITFPVMTAVGNTAANLKALLGQGINDPTPGYNNMIQVRLGDIGGPTFTSVDPSVYWATDILVDPTAGTWQQVYPAVAASPTSTTTTLAATPASPRAAGTSVTLTATVSPTAAGTVQFLDGSTDIGSPVTVSGGTASTSTTTLTPGTHSLSAAFTPADSSAFGASTSTAVSYVITSPATSTTTSLGVTPTSPITVGTQSTLTATVSPSTAAGSVQFFDGATAIGGPVAVAAGSASTTTTFTANTHSVKAVFTPTDPSAFGPSTSAVASYVVDAQPAVSTSVSFDVTPSSPQTFGTPLSLSATVTPSTAVGTVQFLDGTVVVGSGSVSGGAASAAISDLSAGSHQLSAKFVPTNPADFGTSQSSAAGYTINEAASSVSLAVTPAGPVQQGTSITLSATTGPAGVGGTVQFLDGATQLGSAVTVSNGSAHMSTTGLSVGSHSLTAMFSPSSANYTTATSSASSLQITPPPPGTTTTTLAVSPLSPVAQGTLETLAATVTPSTASGTVQFLDGSTAIGSPVPVSGGHAETTTTLGQATHTLSAAFTSSDPASFDDSTSAAASFVVKPPAAPTTTTLALTPTGPITFGSAVTLTATETPSAAGTMTFHDGTTVVGTATVGAGSASVTATGLAGGSHSLTASFLPNAPLDFTGSQSSPTSLTVDAATTSIAVGLSPAGPLSQGASVTMTATVVPATAVGTVTFSNGSAVLGTAPVSHGLARLTTIGLARGQASITAAFAATHSADFGPSTSAPSTIEVLPAPEVGSITMDGTTLAAGVVLPPGATFTVSASGFQPGETVSIVVHSTPITLGTTKATPSGTVSVLVSLPTSLPAGAHTLSLVGSIGTANFAFTIAAPGVPTTTEPGLTTTTEPGVATGASALADTGYDVRSGLGLGIVLLLLGSIALLVTPRRRPGQHRAG